MASEWLLECGAIAGKNHKDHTLKGEVEMDSERREGKPQDEYYDEQQINGTIISPHGKFNAEYEYIQLEDGRVLAKEKKIEIINKDLTSGFSTPEFQAYAFGTADYLSIIKGLENDFEVDLTEHYNKEARPLAYSYAMSKSGGKAANIVKQHKVISESYQVSREEQAQGKKSLLGWLPKKKVQM